MSKPSIANALALQIPTEDLQHVVEALEREIERVRASRKISQKSRTEILPPLVDIWTVYKNALDHEHTILLLCSIR